MITFQSFADSQQAHVRLKEKRVLFLIPDKSLKVTQVIKRNFPIHVLITMDDECSIAHMLH